MKKRRHWLALCSWLLLAVVVASCSKKFDEHYYPSAQLDDNIIGVLEKDGRFSALDRKSTRLNPVTNAHLVCRLLLEKKKQTTDKQVINTTTSDKKVK